MTKFTYSVNTQKESYTCIKTNKETSINLILTSSTLKHVWNYETEDQTECLIECLPGARIGSDNDIQRKIQIPTVSD